VYVTQDIHIRYDACAGLRADGCPANIDGRTFIAGELDLLLRWNGNVWVPDIKTAVVERWRRMQTAAGRSRTGGIT
jgi:hypothetical protein